MVLLHLNEKQKEKISLLNTFDETIIREFCRIASESIHKELSQKTINNAAGKLSIQSQDLKDLIDLITWIFIESAKLNLNDKELKESFLLVGIKDELSNEIENNCKKNYEQLQNYMTNMKIGTIQYDNLEWRVDVKLATRSVMELIEPEVILKFDLKTGNNKEIKILQTDIVTLNYLTNNLEDALNEIKSHYCRRVFRNVV